MRTCIFGGPRTGKTTLAVEMVGRRRLTPVRHTDDLIGVLDWSGQSHRIAFDWFAQPGPWIIEGVAVGRALRKWLAANPEGKPCDEVILLWSPRVTLTPGQARMAAGCAMVWRAIEGELVRRGVVIR
jgi:adenylate kinase family enzyme